MSVELDVDRERLLAELRRDDRAAEVQAKWAEKSARRAEKQERRAERKTARAARMAWLRAVAGSARPIVPLVLVTGFATYGQIDYLFDAITTPTWALAARLAVAVGVAVAYESISLYVQWQAHDLQLLGATSEAARRRWASYSLAAVAGTVQYWHFSHDWSPTTQAIIFALFSASSPWLWGMHTRRAKHIQLVRSGNADTAGAVFSAERWRAFPIQTWRARRWSIAHGVDDPRQAWAGWRAERAADRAESMQPKLQTGANNATETAFAFNSEQPGDDPGDLGDDEGARLPDRRDQGLTRDEEIIDDLRALATAHGRRWPRDQIKASYGIGSNRAGRIMSYLGWPPGRADEGDDPAGGPPR